MSVIADSPQEVLNALGIEYKERTNRLLLCCPFHHDTNPSSGFYLNTKLFHCFACEVSLDTVGFYAKVRGWTRVRTEQEIGERAPDPTDKNSIAVARAASESILAGLKTLSRIDHAQWADKFEKIVWAYQKAMITKSQFVAAFEKWKRQVGST